MKKQVVIFSTALIALVIAGLLYGTKVVADLTVVYPTTIDQAGVIVTLEPAVSSTLNQTAQQAYLLEAQRVVAQRLDQLHLTGYYNVAASQGRLEVTLPDSDNMPYITDLLSRVGAVEFIDGGTQPPLGQFVETGITSPPAGANVYQTLFTGQEITAVLPPDSGQIFYQIEPSTEAAARFSNFVQSEPDQFVCLVIDKQVINCSKMYYWSGEALEILPKLSGGTNLSLSDLEIFLSSGPLPVTLRVVTD